MNTAQRIVKLSTDPALVLIANWAIVSVGMGGEIFKSICYRFADGSALMLIGEERLPVEYIGG